MIEKLKLKKYNSDDLKKYVDEKIGELEKISLMDGFIVSRTRLDELKLLLRNIFSGDNSVKLSTQDLKILLYHSGELDNDIYNFFIQKYLDKNWTNDLWIALFNAIISQWDKPRHIFLQDLGSKKLNICSERFKSSFSFLQDKKGTFRLSEYLQKRQISLFQTPRMLFYGGKIATSDFFIELASVYFSIATENKIAVLEEAVNEYNNPEKFTKVVLPKFIIDSHNKGNFKISDAGRTRLRSLAIKTIGNLNDIELWTLGNAVDSKLNMNLLEARRILLRWAFKKTIERFFLRDDRKSIDKKRVDFWIKKIDKIVETYDKNPQKSCFCIFSSNSNVIFDAPGLIHRYWSDDNEAIVIRIGQYSIVEFLKVGAVYFYHQEHSMCNRVWYNNTITRSGILKDTQVQQATQDDILYHIDILGKTIKIGHRGDWQPNFDRWLTNIVMPTIKDYK